MPRTLEEMPPARADQIAWAQYMRPGEKTIFAKADGDFDCDEAVFAARCRQAAKRYNVKAKVHLSRKHSHVAVEVVGARDGQA